MLPWEFPPWQTVSGYFPSWRDQGSWKRIHR
ncbi:MAG: IS5/IS1182 family transposase, partial [Cyanobacteria bacterium QS_3_48_167]